jgi:hypothetical protein
LEISNITLIAKIGIRGNCTIVDAGVDHKQNIEENEPKDKGFEFINHLMEV